MTSSSGSLRQHSHQRDTRQFDSQESNTYSTVPFQSVEDGFAWAVRLPGFCKGPFSEVLRQMGRHVAETNLRFTSDFQPHALTTASTESLRQVLNEHVDRPVADPTRQYMPVAAELDHELLSHGLVLADTPGFGAAQFGEHGNSYEQAVPVYCMTQCRRCSVSASASIA